VKRGIELDRVTRIVSGEMHLEEVRLALEPGTLNVLLGRTRAGKTSLLRVMAGLDRPTRGSIHAGGVDVTRVGVRSRNVAMVYQQFINYPSLTVYENIASPLRLRRGMDAAALDRRVRETAAALRIDDLLDRLPGELSGGQQQRTAMARALVKDADLLLLDEPLANLDYKLREELRAEIRRLFRGRDAVVVYATTEPTEALLLGGTTVVLHEGRVLQSGPALDVYHAPATDRVGQIFSDPQMSLLDVDVLEGGEARLAEGIRFPLPEHLRSMDAGRCRIGIRANHVRLGKAEASDIRVPATALLEEISGSETTLHASAGGASLAAQIEGVHRHTLGSRIELFLAGARMFAFSVEGALLRAPPRPTALVAPTAPVASTPSSSPSAHGPN
jgi:glycerol transport system ATP-binding protein